MKIRDYQEEAIKVSLKSKKGIVCLPTGSGKTLIQSQIILRNFKKNKGHKVYFVLSPRIVLSYQLMKEYFITFNEAKEKFWYAGLHSGNKVDIKEFEEARDGDIDFQDIAVTTSSSEIRTEIEKARIQNLPIIIFGTYHSADRCHLFMNDSEFDAVICDEAHYLVSSQFEDLVREVDGIRSKKTLFFTATLMKTASDQGKGMNNEKRFGQVIYQKVPRWMIDNGYMVRPRMHIIRFDREIDGKELISNAGRIISECLHQHEYVTRRNAKIFVTCTGTPMIQEILGSREILDIRRRKGISVYAVASDPEIGNQIDGVRYSRQEFLSRLRRDGLDSNKGMLILHIDILSEGIDVPGITGILPFRSLKKSKFIQTLGRASRITKEDYESFVKGEYGHQDLDAMLKPYAWIMIPDIEGEDTSEEIVTMIRDLRDYGFEPSEDIYISNEMGKMPPVSLMNPLIKPDVRNPALNAALDEIFHEFENEAIAKLLEDKNIEELIEKSI